MLRVWHIGQWFSKKVLRQLFALRLALLPIALLLSSVHAISYTVQIIAVSTDTAAQRLKEQLNDEGYPAYLVSVSTSEGPVYRLRVGSFVNREAAAKFAEAMQGVLDSNPTPALAEGIPFTLAPLEAELLGAYRLSRTLFEVLPWQGEVAFRTQPLIANEEAHYRVVDITEFKAWNAEPQSDGSIIRIYSHYLWPEAWPIKTETELSLERQAKLNELSDQLGLSISQLESFEFIDPEGVPYLVLVQKFNPLSKEGTLFKALGQPESELTPYGPELIWLDGEKEQIIKPIEVIFEPQVDDNNTQLFESREGWQASEDGDFLQLHTDEEDKTWRAAVGRPLWVRENWLITNYKGEILLYKLKRR